MNRYDQLPVKIVTGSGVAGPMVLTTSGLRIDSRTMNVTLEVRYNMNGTANTGYVPVGENPFAAGAQGLTIPTPAANGGSSIVPVSSTGPLVGGAPAGQFLIGGSSDGVYYTDLGVSVSGLYGVSTSGTRLINLSGSLPPWINLTYANTASSGVFDVIYSARNT